MKKHSKLNIILIILIIIMAGYLIRYKLFTETIQKPANNISASLKLKNYKKEKLNVYIPGKNCEYFSKKPVTFLIKKGYTNYDYVKAVLKKYFQVNPWTSPGTKITNLFFANHILYINMNKNFYEKVIMPEQLLVYVSSFVNTIVKNTNYKKIKILIADHENNYITKNLGIKNYFTYNSTFFKAN